MIDIDSVSEAPWRRYDWHARLISLDGCPADDFVREDVKRIVAHGTTPTNDWDGDTAGIIELNDGRFAGWESTWGPTGSGFCCDAYGGDADILFAREVATIANHITERARELLVYAEAAK